MHTGLDKTSNRLPNQDMAEPLAVPPPAATEYAHEAVSMLEGLRGERSSCSVSAVGTPSESDIAIHHASSRQFQSLAAIIAAEELSGRAIHAAASGMIFLSFKDFQKYVEESAEALKKEIEVERKLTKIRQEHERARKERSQEKCAVFWQKAEELFHEAFTRINKERVRIASQTPFQNHPE